MTSRRFLRFVQQWMYMAFLNKPSWTPAELVYIGTTRQIQPATVFMSMERLHNNNPAKCHFQKCAQWDFKKQKSHIGSLCKWEAWWKLSPQRYVYFFETAKLLRINLCIILVFQRRLHINCVSFVLLQSITSEGLVLQQIEFSLDSPVELQTITQILAPSGV